MSILLHFNRLSIKLLLITSTRLQPMIYLFSGGADSKAQHFASTEHTPAICFFIFYDSSHSEVHHILQRNSSFPSKRPRVSRLEAPLSLFSSWNSFPQPAEHIQPWLSQPQSRLSLNREPVKETKEVSLSLPSVLCRKRLGLSVLRVRSKLACLLCQLEGHQCIYQGPRSNSEKDW